MAAAANAVGATVAEGAAGADVAGAGVAVAQHHGRYPRYRMLTPCHLALKHVGQQGSWDLQSSSRRRQQQLEGGLVLDGGARTRAGREGLSWVASRRLEATRSDQRASGRDAGEAARAARHTPHRSAQPSATRAERRARRGAQAAPAPHPPDLQTPHPHSHTAHGTVTGLDSRAGHGSRVTQTDGGWRSPARLASGRGSGGSRAVTRGTGAAHRISASLFSRWHSGLALGALSCGVVSWRGCATTEPV